MLKKSLNILAVATLCTGVVLFLQGCPRSPCGPLAEGKVYEAELQVLGDGTLYALEIESEGGDGDNVNCEQEGENEGENDPCDGEGGGEAELSAQVSAVDVDRGVFELLGGALTVAIGPDTDTQFALESLEVGTWVEVEGALGTDGLFHAEEVEAAGEHENEIMGVLENLTDNTFTMIGMTIAYDDSTEKECEDEDEGEDDDDDDEHEGEDDDD
jgi:hypothetical protein